MKQDYCLNSKSEAVFNNNADYCVGTGRMGLALQKAYQEQLKVVQDEIGFSHIRGHGLFSDDMAIYQTYKDENGNEKTEYNFTYLDIVMDNYLELNIRPFLELGFMPKKMASSDQTVFYWKGNVTPPKDYVNWQELIKATLNHLIERYGREEVVTWPIEVWNEPNLPGFWKDADINEYFVLFKKSFEAVKQVDIRFKVGGPAICGVDDVRWLKEFLAFCDRENIKPDMITRHHYMFDKPEFEGHYSYGDLRDTYETLNELKVSRELIDNVELTKGTPMHITEFNTSYCPDSPVHDTVQNAAYIAWQISHMGQYGESYSYWTFGDIFEEKGVPFTPFHGGFGLVANGCIKKPTFWTFVFFKSLQGKCIVCSDSLVAVKCADGTIRGVAYNLCTDKMEELSLKVEIDEDLLGIENYVNYNPTDDNDNNENYVNQSPDVAGGENYVNHNSYIITSRLIDEEHGNPLRLWHEMGEPSCLSKSQLKLLKDHAVPYVQINKIENSGNKLMVNINLKANGVMWFEIGAVTKTGDRGYRYFDKK